MYPDRDFRNLITNPNADYDTIVRSLCREPFPEVLYYWQTTGKPNELYNIYNTGISYAISKDRYPLYQLSLLTECPEFKDAAITGLTKLWSSFKFYLDDGRLNIDLSCEDNIGIDKLSILKSPLPANANLSKRAKVVLDWFINLSSMEHKLK